MLRVARFANARRALSDRILVNINTQCDLLLPGGAMPVINRSDVLPNIQRMMSWARVESLPALEELEPAAAVPDRYAEPFCWP